MGSRNSKEKSNNKSNSSKTYIRPFSLSEDKNKEQNSSTRKNIVLYQKTNNPISTDIQIKTIIKAKISKIFILKDKRFLLLCKRGFPSISVMNNRNFKKEIEFKINKQINDLILLSNGNLLISFDKKVYIYKINKNNFELIQEIEIQIKEGEEDEEEEYSFRGTVFCDERELPKFTKAKFVEYKNENTLLILKRIPINESKYGIYDYKSIIDIYSLTENKNYSYTKSLPKIYCMGKILSNNNNLIIHGRCGSNPMGMSYSISLYNLENEKEHNINCVEFFNEKHELYFISNNKLLHYYKKTFDFFIYIYNLENNENITEIKKEIKNKIKYIYNNEKYIFFYYDSTEEKGVTYYVEEDHTKKNKNQLIFYKYDYNLNLIEEIRNIINIQIFFQKIIRVKKNCILLYEKDKMIILEDRNLPNNKNSKKLISKIFH